MPTPVQQALNVAQRYVLFVRPGCAASQKAYETVHALTGLVDIQNTDAMRARGEPFPPYLRGVPTLLDVQSKQAFAGKACIARLAQVDREVNGAQRQEFRAQIEDGTTRGMVPVSPFVAPEEGTHGDPVGLGGGAGDDYAPCEFQPSDAIEYRDGKLKGDQVQQLIEARQGPAATATSTRREPTQAEINAIMATIQETSSESA